MFKNDALDNGFVDAVGARLRSERSDGSSSHQAQQQREMFAHTHQTARATLWFRRSLGFAPASLTLACSDVSLEPMKPSVYVLSGALVGAMLGAGAMWAFGRTATSAAPPVGSAVPYISNAGAPPSNTSLGSMPGTSAEPATVASLQARYAALQAQLADVQQRADTLQAMYDAVVPKEAPEDGGPHPSQATLLKWAKECRTEWDFPNFDKAVQTEFSDIGRAEPAEQPALVEALREVHAKWMAMLRSAYIEVTGDSAGAKSLEPAALMTEIEQKGGGEEVTALRAQLAKERAGLVQPPPASAKLSPVERMLRANATLGDDTENALAKRVGAVRARAIRGSGWGSSSASAGCAHGD